MSTKLYHYTDTTGLKGILTEGTLRATEIGFLSDISEYHTAMTMIRNLIDSLIPKARIPENTLLERVSELFIIMHASAVQGIFVTSFTAEEGNKLNQWRSYCPIGGFSIGFNSDYIKDRYPVSECIYDADLQENFLRDSLQPHFKNKFLPWVSKNLARIFLPGESFKYYEQPQFIDFYNHMREVAPQIKHSKYVDENEWRVIIKRDLIDESILFRPGRYFPIPYIELKEIDLGQIEEIVIGPTPEKKVAFRALRALQANLGISCDIVVDTIPYRSW